MVGVEAEKATRRGSGMDSGKVALISGDASVGLEKAHESHSLSCAATVCAGSYALAHIVHVHIAGNGLFDCSALMGAGYFLGSYYVEMECNDDYGSIRCISTVFLDHVSYNCSAWMGSGYS